MKLVEGRGANAALKSPYTLAVSFVVVPPSTEGEHTGVVSAAATTPVVLSF